MEFRMLRRLRAMAFIAALTVPVFAAAQVQQAAKEGKEHHHYKLIDMGTFGGPASFINDGQSFINGARGVNERGVTWGGSATSTPALATSNPFVCGSIDRPVPFIIHAFRWKNGTVMDLGALPGNSNCSIPFSVNAHAEAVGISENGEVDPLTGINQTRAVIWKDGEIKDLGSFGGNQNAALAMNNRGQIVGSSLNTVPDPFSIVDSILGSSNGTQTRAALWQHGEMKDLGTQGGDDAVAGMINERGQIAGISYTTTTTNPATDLPTLDPFFWENGIMMDIGSLGGAFGETKAINNRGQVIGGSSVAANPGACLFGGEGDPNCHPFLWDEGKLIDLNTSTIGGYPLIAYGINDAAEIVGIAAFPDLADLHAFLWRKGVATDLGTLTGDCSDFANAINSHSQVVGGTFSCADGTHSRAFLWEDGAIIDLNTLISAGSPLQLVIAFDINDRGEIAGIGVTPGVLPANYNAQGHAFVLIPCEDGHPGIEGCDYSFVDATAVQSSTAPLASARTTGTQPGLAPSEVTDRIRALLLGHSRRFRSLPKK
jgi:probable HAF family extracellular repeat protein